MFFGGTPKSSETTGHPYECQQKRILRHHICVGSLTPIWAQTMTISSEIQLRAIGILNSFRSDNSNISASSPNNSADSATSSAPTLPGPADHPDASVDVAKFTRWLDLRVTDKGLGEKTALCYRKWVASHLESVGHTSTQELRAWIPPSRRQRLKEAASISPENVLLNGVDDSKLFVSSAKKNQRYLSFVSENVLELLKADLMPPARTKDEENNPSRNRIASMETAMWFMCTLWTGLRPHEWPYARYLEEHYDPDTQQTIRRVLEVTTLKQSGRREDNPLKDKRYLVLEDWPDNQLRALKMFLEIVYQHEDAKQFGNFYDRRRKTLQRSWARILKFHGGTIEHLGAEMAPSNKPKLKMLAATTSSPGVFEGNSLCFYTARHAFAEEARRSGTFSRYDIAAVLGHSMITNQSYYGPRKEHLEREHRYTLPKPWPGESDAIAMWDQTANPLRGKFTNRDDLSQSLLDTESKNRNREDADGISSFWLGL